MNQAFTNFLATLITVFVLILWIIPAYMMYHGAHSWWGFIYLLDIVVTVYKLIV